tara:strand:+ start:9597 stop:10115 length:519 start_codon:yes stop_codon:yes gene_type:complete
MKNNSIKIIIISFFAFIFLIFYRGLNISNVYKPSENINKIIPRFSTNTFFENKLINTENIFDEKKFYLLNIWASWCAPCKEEHPLLMKLKDNDKLEIIGLNYKDNHKNAKKFINDLGNPYSVILLDNDGTKAIYWGAYGVPETFLVFEDQIVKKYIGPLNSKILLEIENLIK